MVFFFILVPFVIDAIRYTEFLGFGPYFMVIAKFIFLKLVEKYMLAFKFLSMACVFDCFIFKKGLLPTLELEHLLIHSALDYLPGL